MGQFREEDPHLWCKSAIAILPAGFHVAKGKGHGGGRNVTIAFEEFIVAIHKYAKELELETEILPDINDPARFMLFISGYPRSSSKIKSRKVTYPIELNHAVQHGVKPAASNIFRNRFNLGDDDKGFFYDPGTLF